MWENESVFIYSPFFSPYPFVLGLIDIIFSSCEIAFVIFSKSSNNEAYDFERLGFEIKINDTTEKKISITFIMMMYWLKTLFQSNKKVHLPLCFPWLSKNSIEQQTLWLRTIDGWIKYKWNNAKNYEYDFYYDDVHTKDI